MKYTGRLLLVIMFLCVCIQPNASANNVAGIPDKRIIIELNTLPINVKPGNKPITLSKDLLSKLLPELKNPRRMSFQDLDDPMEQNEFIEDGYVFVLTGDFNGNGVADIAFVGKYDNPDNPEKNCFVAIVSIKGKQIIREYFSKLESPKVYLINVLEYKPKIDAIGVVYKFYSEECGYLYWAGRKYDFELCKATF